MKISSGFLSIILFPIFTVAACSSDEIGNSKDVNPETVYTSYAVNYSEGDDSVSCFLQYRFAGEHGTTLVLTTPSKVTIDGNEVLADSASFTGAYYEKKFSASNFDGEHVIVFTDVNGKTHEEKFNFHRISCSTEIPASINKKSLAIEFNGALTNDVIDINVSDTSSATEDIHISSQPQSNRLTVTAAQLKKLNKGSLQFNIYRHQEIPLLQPTQEGGKFSINYDIKDAVTELKED